MRSGGRSAYAPLPAPHRGIVAHARHAGQDLRPVAAFRQRGMRGRAKLEDFNAPEVWHPERPGAPVRFLMHPAGAGYRHPVSVTEVRQRLEALPPGFTDNLGVVQWSPMTKKRGTFPCYGMQWGTAVYLYPIEADLIERYVRPPKPQQVIEARMYGGEWRTEKDLYLLIWTEQAIRDFYLNNVLIHEIGHLLDQRNTSPASRERYANWFAIEHGYRPTQGERRSRRGGLIV